MKKISEHIAAIHFFSSMTAEQHEELAMIVVDQEVNRGKLIFSEGDPGEGFYIVVTGKVKIFKVSFDGKEQILHILGPGEPFAEVAVFTGSSYPANAMALEKSRIFFIPRKEFVHLISQQPALAMSMLATLSLRLKQFTHMIEALSLKEVPGRLAEYILLLEKQQGRDKGAVELTISKTLLASLLGTIPETLSRIFTRMSKQGFISIEGSIVSILDREGLIGLAEGEVKL